MNRIVKPAQIPKNVNATVCVWEKYVTLTRDLFAVMSWFQHAVLKGVPWFYHHNEGIKIRKCQIEGHLCHLVSEYAYRLKDKNTDEVHCTDDCNNDHTFVETETPSNNGVLGNFEIPEDEHGD